MNNIEAVKARLTEEHSELNEKIKKLSAFIQDSDVFKSLNSQHQELLKRQLNVMLDYQQILIERIKLI